MDLYELMQRARKKDADSCYEIIVKFEGLIKKYAENWHMRTRRVI